MSALKFDLLDSGKLFIYS